jgi:hypothetical protein
VRRGTGSRKSTRTIESHFVSDGVGADGDLFPVGAVTEGEARNGAGATSAKINHGTDILRWREAGGGKGSDVCKRPPLEVELFAEANFFEAAWYFFAHMY